MKSVSKKAKVVRYLIYQEKNSSAVNRADFQTFDAGNNVRYDVAGSRKHFQLKMEVTIARLAKRYGSNYTHKKQRRKRKKDGTESDRNLLSARFATPMLRSLLSSEVQVRPNLVCNDTINNSLPKLG